MGFEIDFLPVEAGERSGDAIAFRIWDQQRQFVGIIDGGYTDSGNELVNHVRAFYGTDVVDLAILTHPDDDHATGMVPVLEGLRVQNLWMHQPWNHGDLARLFRNNRVTDTSVCAALQRSLNAAKDVETEALRQEIDIVEPFANTDFQQLVYVIGPTRAFYDAQIAHFRGTPLPAVPRRAVRLPVAAPRRVEDWTHETLDDVCDTTAENETSAILAIKFGDDYWGLFTADAGAAALTGALDWLDACNFSVANFQFVQVPHHGSEHNIGRTIMNRLLGQPQQQDRRTRVAFASTSSAAEKHPYDCVMNAFRRRGAWPYATKGRKIRQASADAPPRAGWTNLDPYPFYQGAA